MVARAELPEDFGDWEAEYRAFVKTCALVSRADRGAVRVTGERRAEMLDGLLSNDVSNLVETGRHALILTAKGRVLSDLRVFPRSDDLLLDVPHLGLGNLLATFKKYLPPIYARYEDLSGLLTQLGVYGPRAAEVAEEALGDEVPEEHLGVRALELDDTAVLVIRSQRLAADGVEFLARQESVTALWSRLVPVVSEAGGCAAGLRALEAAHVEWGIPRYGVDMTESNLAQETGLEEDAISYEKGCFMGQEVVARIHFRGHVNRFLRGLEFEGGLPNPSTHVYDRGKDVGIVTTAVRSPEFGPIGLGYVRREIEPAAVLRWSDGEHEGEATVRALPFRYRSL